jgi:hypothetical protein
MVATSPEPWEVVSGDIDALAPVPTHALTWWCGELQPRLRTGPFQQGTRHDRTTGQGQLLSARRHSAHSVTSNNGRITPRYGASRFWRKAKARQQTTSGAEATTCRRKKPALHGAGEDYSNSKRLYYSNQNCLFLCFIWVFVLFGWQWRKGLSGCRTGPAPSPRSLSEHTYLVSTKRQKRALSFLWKPLSARKHDALRIKKPKADRIAHEYFEVNCEFFTRQL